MAHTPAFVSPFSGSEESQEFYRAEELFDAGDFESAARVWDQQRKVHPSEAMIHFVLGRCSHKQRALDEAKVYYKTATELNPKFWQAYYEMGSLLIEQAKYKEAIENFYFLLQHQPDDGNAWTLLGGVLSKIGEHDTAIICCRQALKLHADDAAAMYNLAFAFGAKGMTGEALQWIDAALRMQPHVPIIHMFRASLLLREGHYREGWREWEWRLLKDDFRALNVRSAQPYLWNGESLEGKTLLVWCEQGFGDTIQFARYLRCMKNLGARVIFECQKELLPVLGGVKVSPVNRNDSHIEAKELLPILGGVEGADVVFERFAECPEAFDFHVPIASLPLHCNTTPQSIPYAEGYIHADAVKHFADRFSLHGEGLRIGLAWEGSRLNPANHHRSCSPQECAPLFNISGCVLYGLQHDIGRNGLPNEIEHIGVRSMAELAGVIALLDLIITIDTSVAHLAGAMGKETWLLLSALPDWRWELLRDTTPWYTSMRIFRQETIGEWSLVMEEVAELLRTRSQSVNAQNAE